MERIPIPIYWVGTSKMELMAFPEAARQDAGYQLHRLQTGHTPQDWKPLKHLGRGVTGVQEIRIWQDDATFRIAYVMKFGGYITVLHCWQKTTQATRKITKAIISRRYKEAYEGFK
jgi:phage-related protein